MGERLRTWVLFCAVGLVTATWAARVPAVQDRLGLSPGALAVVALAVEAGALCGLPLGAVVVDRFGTRRAIAAGLAVFAPGLTTAALAPDLAVLAVGLGGWAAANSVLDVAINAQGVDVERRAGRPLLSGLHAGQSCGLLLGAGVAFAATAAEVPLLAHTAGVAAAALAAGLLAAAGLPSAGRDGGRSAVRPTRGLSALSALAFCVFLLDGTASTWLAVHVRGTPGGSEGLAAAAYLGFTAALLAGRLAGDRLTARFGRRGLTRAGAGLAAAGLATAVLAPGTALPIAGWAVLGLALAPLAPVVLAAAPGAGAGGAPAALATVTTIGYLGSFTGPPAVGAVAEATGSLGAGLAAAGAAALAAAVLAGRALPGRGR
ncbi:MFS transporter [Blastococcus sp. SYSU D00669]